MGALTKLGRQRMDSLIEAHGDAGVADMVCGMVSVGASLYDISKAEGMPYSVLWGWIKADEGRLAAYREALEARADLEAHRALEIADNASSDEVNLARLRVDTRLKLAGKWGKSMYGEGGGGGGGVGVINITISPVESGITIDQVEDA